MKTPGCLIVWLVFAALAASTGCHESVHDPKEYDVTAQYLGLEGKRVGVIVAVSDHTHFRHPGLQRQLAREISRRIQLNLPDSQVMNPDTIVLWQADNEFWTARRPSVLLDALRVERLVMVEVGEFRLSDTGDTNIKRGVISANVNVVEDDAPDPDNFGFTQSLRVAFPDEFRTRIGLVVADEQDIQTIVISRFTEEAAGLFYDFTMTR